MANNQNRTFDWKPRFDERSRRFGVSEVVPEQPEVKKLWTAGPVLDQGQEGACVGFGWTGELMAAPKPFYPTPEAGNAYAQAYYEHAKTLDEWPGECVDEDTECLTLDGWKSGIDLREGDQILTFDIETEQTRWAVVERVHRGEARYHEYSMRGFSTAVTDNHRWPVRRRSNGSAFPRPFRMTTTAEWRSGDEFIRAAPCSDLPSQAKWDDDLVELVAWVMCEGHYRSRSRSVVVSQTVHQGRVADLMQRMGVSDGHDFGNGHHSWEFGGALARQVRDCAPGRAPEGLWLRSLTLRQLRLFLDVCTLADGCESPAQGSRRSRTSFAQKTGAILDSWLIACTLAGQPVSRSRADGGTHRNVESWTLRGSNSVEVRKLTKGVEHVGSVWCPQTEVGTFVARRHGSIFITGNSYEGTSVLAGAKTAVERGFITEYRWCFGVEDVRRAVIGAGPVVIGVKWADQMYDTSDQGLVTIGGENVGGHCLVITGYDPAMSFNEGGKRVRERVFRWRNSWGNQYGRMWRGQPNGNGWITYSDLSTLLADEGEACIPMGRKTVKF